MAVKFAKAIIFDPAMSGEEHIPVRLELYAVAGPEGGPAIPGMPTYQAVTEDFEVANFSQLMKIKPAGTASKYYFHWDDEDPELCASIYNSSPGVTHPVLPVTVSESGDFWEVWYMKVRDVRPTMKSLLTGDASGYEILPDPTHAIYCRTAWYFQHRSRACVRCARTVIDSAPDTMTIAEIDSLARRVDVGNPVEVYKHRLVTLCFRHESEHNREAAGQRSQY